MIIVLLTELDSLAGILIGFQEGKNDEANDGLEEVAVIIGGTVN